MDRETAKALSALRKERRIEAPPIRGVAAWTLLAAGWVAGAAYAVHVLAGVGGRTAGVVLLLAAIGAAIVVRLTTSLRQNTRLMASVHGAAITDRLTGLANRQLLFERLDHALERQQRDGDTLAVLFCDLDDFKSVNHDHGHELGDRVIVEVAGRLRGAVRGQDAEPWKLVTAGSQRLRDTICRLGGDEFVVLLEGLAHPSGAVKVAEHILGSVRAPCVLDEHVLFLDASVGVTHCTPGDGRGPADLLRDADTAMYEAKRAGKHRIQLFRREMHEQFVARSELIRDLRDAVAAGQLRLHYQPQVDLASGAVCAVEALVRWQHPVHGLLSPERFVTVAESVGVIGDIDDWALREACAQMRAWDDAGMRSIGMAINVSARRLITGDLAAAVAAALADTGADPARLEIELTETVAVEHDALAVKVLQDLRALGVAVAIDDFGMGHSALSRLHAFPVDRIKIDRSFVASLAEGTERGSLVEAMIAMGRSLGLGVVAEGVETYEHLEALRTLGCASAQGYLFSRPVPREEIVPLVAAGPIVAGGGRYAGPDRAVAERPSAAALERLIHSMLAELERLTGLESTYLTSIDWERATQRITRARNVGMIDIPEGLTIDWSDTVCRLALEQGVSYTADVPGTFPGSAAGRKLGLQTYVSVPLVNADGHVEGTLCGASRLPLDLGADAVTLMEHFAQIIARGGAEADAVGAAAGPVDRLRLPGAH